MMAPNISCPGKKPKRPVYLTGASQKTAAGRYKARKPICGRIEAGFCERMMNCTQIKPVMVDLGNACLSAGARVYWNGRVF